MKNILILFLLIIGTWSCDEPNTNDNPQSFEKEIAELMSPQLQKQFLEEIIILDQKIRNDETEAQKKMDIKVIRINKQYKQQSIRIEIIWKKLNSIFKSMDILT